MASDSAVEATNGVARQPLRFADLPGELQQEIVSHVPQHDLICLCLVSRRFRDLAAAELYRSFNIIFPDDDDPAYDSPVDGLANGLETFATSDYDYAKHLRDVSLDTVSAGDKAELSYKHYLASQSCGKFMNTLILLMLRKANALEKLRYVVLRLPQLAARCPADNGTSLTFNTIFTGGTFASNSVGRSTRRCTRSTLSGTYISACKPALPSTSLHRLCPSFRFLTPQASLGAL